MCCFLVSIDLVLVDGINMIWFSKGLSYNFNLMLYEKWFCGLDIFGVSVLILNI